MLAEDLLGLDIKFCEDPSEGPVHINYSANFIPDTLNIRPHGLLSERNIVPREISMGEYAGMPVLFMQPDGDIPFDALSMLFYMLSRYEEYLPFEADRHGRFPHTESLAWKEGFLEKAVVNRVGLMLRSMLHEKFPELEIPAPGYRFIPTVDIDIAYAHLGKGLTRTYGAMLKQLGRGNLAEIGRRIRTMRGKNRDPYDNYDMMLEVFSEFHLNPIFFILAGKPGPYDRNLSTGNRHFAALIRRLAEHVGLGVHPSYGAGDHAAAIMEEKQRVAEASGRTIVFSRQHFVRMRFPHTYRALIDAGIQADFSMGYASVAGFRAGIASPFRFYDLGSERETSLYIYPFAFMDTTLEDYMKLSPEEYHGKVKPIIKEVKEVGGTLIGIWHNYALANCTDKHIAFRDIINTAAQL
jgi:hypothetical protein